MYFLNRALKTCGNNHISKYWWERNNF